jgi:hypothetical protein
MESFQMLSKVIHAVDFCTVAQLKLVLLEMVKSSLLVCREWKLLATIAASLARVVKTIKDCIRIQIFA